MIFDDIDIGIIYIVLFIFLLFEPTSSAVPNQTYVHNILIK